MSWYKFDNGKTIGQKGISGGKIIFDEEHELGARITLEKGGDLLKDQFGIHYWIYDKYKSDENITFLSGFYRFSQETEANLGLLRNEIEKVLYLIPSKSERNYQNMSKVWLATYNFAYSNKRNI